MSFNDRIILDEDPDKTRYVVDYQGRIAAAQSFQDILETFELLFPGTTAKHKAFAEQSDWVISAVAVMQDASATPEAQYDAMQKLDGVASYKLDQVLRLAGKTDLDIDKLTHQLKTSIPTKMLDNYILTAQDMTVRLNSVKAKEAEFKAVAQQITDIQDVIIKKYEPQHKEADAKFKEVMNLFNEWQSSMGDGYSYGATQKYKDWLKAQNAISPVPWPPEMEATFQEEYRKGLSEWQAKLVETTQKHKSPVYGAEAKEMSEATEELYTQQNALKAELDQAKQKVYDAVINSILSISPVSEEQAAEWSKGNVIYDKSAMSKSAKNGYGKKDIERDVQLFYRLTGGRLPRLEFTTTRQARSCAAHWSGELFIGHNFGQRTLWHEMAHLLEDDPKIKAAAMAFRDRRRDDAQLHRLKDLVPGSNYDPKEVAYKDSWLDPYIGKDYGQTATEVISMGMQQLASIPMLFELQEKDPEHLAFMLGLCMTKPVIDTEAVAKKQARTQEKVAKASKVENLQKELDKQVAEAGDFWSKDGISIETEKQWSYKSRKYVERAEIRYNKKFDEQGRLNSYNNYTVRNEKAAKRALFVWYKAGKPSGQGSGDFNLGNIVYQFEHSKGMNWPMVDFALNQPQSVGA